MSTLLSVGGVLLQGLLITVIVTIGAVIVAALSSLAAGVARFTGPLPARWFAVLYISVFRGTSAVVQLFWAYYVLPFFGLEVGALVIGIIVLGLNTGSYGAEIVRGALEAIPKGQWEAAQALHLTHRQTLTRIILPQAVARMLPPFGNLLVELLKNSALVSMITLADLTFQANSILRGQYPSQTILIFSGLLVIYYVLSSLLLYGMGILEKRVIDWRGEAVR